MNMKMYAIFDDKIGEFLTPFFAPSDKHATKIVRDSFSSESQLVLYPGDYTLQRLGDFDTEKGLLSQDSMSEVCSIRSLVPVSLRRFVLDGSYGGVNDGEEKKED